MSLSKNTLSYIRSLKEKKYRQEHHVFVAEGDKIVKELLTTMRCQLLLATQDFIDDNSLLSADELIVVNNKQLEQASSLKTPQRVLGVFYMPVYERLADLSRQLILALDGIQDPGNMGTILRLADWYGIKNVFCSRDTVDIYNAKVVQATMGALARVHTHYVDLEIFFQQHAQMPVYGTYLDGNNIYSEELSSEGIIVMGNEGNGIRPTVGSYINKRLYIPPYPQTADSTSESLNVAIATAIVCSEFRRRTY